MILLSALLAGWLAGWSVARLHKQPWRIPPIRYAWLAILAFVPQIFAIYLPAPRVSLSVEWTAASIISSQITLLVFCWFNRHIPGILILATGLAANLLVIIANGGFMPISLETASRLVSSEILAVLEPGSRFGWKDILLLPEDTHLAVLSDCLLLPDWFPYQVAFSAGDVLIALGAFWMMVKGSKTADHQKESGC